MTRTLPRSSNSRTSRRSHRFAPLFHRTSDPLGFEAGDANVFRYVGNAPTNATDPSGLLPEEESGEKTQSEWVVIVTGFGRTPKTYKTDEANPSNHIASQVAQELKNRKIPCESVPVIAVNWGEFERVLGEQIAKHDGKRIIWIAFGAGPGQFQIETVADNKRARDRDISGNRPGEKNVPALNDTSSEAMDQEESQLSTKAIAGIASALTRRNFATRSSDQAHDYICESAAFALFKSDRIGAIEAGIFIHVHPTLLNKRRIEQFSETLVNALFEESGQPIPGRLVPQMPEDEK